MNLVHHAWKLILYCFEQWWLICTFSVCQCRGGFRGGSGWGRGFSRITFDSKFHVYGNFRINLINLGYRIYPKYSHVLPSGHMTFIQRRLNVDATSWRCIDVEATLYRRHVSAGYFLSYTSLQQVHFLPMIMCKIAGWVSNRLDPDQTPRSAASDLDLHCLLT